MKTVTMQLPIKKQFTVQTDEQANVWNTSWYYFFHSFSSTLDISNNFLCTNIHIHKQLLSFLKQEKSEEL